MRTADLTFEIDAETHDRVVVSCTSAAQTTRIEIQVEPGHSVLDLSDDQMTELINMLIHARTLKQEFGNDSF